MRPLPLLAAVLVLSLFGPPAGAVGAETGAVEVNFDLPANHGFHAGIEDSSEGVTLAIERKGRGVSYRVQGEVTETGVKAQFGKLGLIDVVFEPTETRTGAPRDCSGKPSTFSEGFFVGTIEFTGERKYVRIEGTRVKGRLDVWREPSRKCPGSRRPGPPQVEARRSHADSGDDGESASLLVRGRRCSCFFGAYAERDHRGRGPTILVGFKSERREQMEISRVTYAEARPAAFTFDHAAGTATVQPPFPFSGHGKFKRRPHARDLWRSSIRVPFLGADPVQFRGRGFRASLAREIPGD